MGAACRGEDVDVEGNFFATDGVKGSLVISGKEAS